MNVGELRAALAELPDEWPVILQKDAEGNGYSPLDCMGERMYEADSTWSGECYMTNEWIEQHPGEGYSIEDDGAPEDAVRVLLLQPVN